MPKGKNNYKSDMYYTSEYKRMINNSSTTNEKLNSIIDRTNKNYSEIFGGTKEQIAPMIAYSNEMRNALKETEELMYKINELTEKNEENVSLLSEKYKVSEKDVENSLDSIVKYKEILSEIIKEENKRNSFKKGSDEYNFHNDKLKELRNKRNSFKKEKIDKGLTKILYKNKNNADIKEGIETHEKIASIQNTIIENQDKFNKQALQSHSTLKKVNRMFQSISDIGRVFVGLFKDGANKWLDIDDSVFKTGRSIGLATSQIRGYQKNILDSYGDMAANLGMTFDEMFKFQENYAKNTGRAIVLTNEEVSSLAGISKLVGEASTNEMVKNMDDLGASTKTATDYLAINRARAQSIGLDAAKSSELFANNIKLASKYNFREGVNGISKMTILSQKLKFNMDSIASAADKFETIEGAISTSANLQMLGGTFANQFSNPMEAMNMAMLDMEGFTNKVIDTFSSKAIFNRENGQVEMSAIDKRFLKEASKQLGISYQDAWNIAAQKAKIGDIERNIKQNENFSESDKAFIASKSKYDSETKEHKITYFNEEGQEKSIAIGDINKDLLDTIKGQEIPEKAIQGDVKGIHNLLSKYLTGEVKRTKTGKEIKKGIIEAKNIEIANTLDGIFDYVKIIANNFSNGTNVGLKSAIGFAAGGVISSIFNRYFSGSIYGYLKTKTAGILGNNGLRGTRRIFNGGPFVNPNVTSSASGNSNTRGSSSSSPSSGASNATRGASNATRGASNATRGASNATRGASNATRGASNATRGASNATRGASNATRGASNTARGASKGLSKIFSKIPKGGKIGLAIAATTAVAYGASKLFGNKNENENQTSNNSNNEFLNEDNSVISELQKQTNILSLIAKAKGISQFSHNNNYNEYSSTNSEYSSTNNEYSSINNDIINGETKSNKLVDLGLLSATLFSKTNPYAQIAMGGYDIFNASSTYKEQISKIEKSNLSYKEKDKLIDNAVNKRNERYGSGIGGAAGSIIGASLGSALGPIGTAVGAVAGNWVGNNIGGFLGKSYNKAKDFLFGKEMSSADKAQEQYEVTKMGEANISDPQLHQKAALATCKIHDLLISIWNHINGKQSNGKIKDRGLIGGIYNTAKNIITYPFKLGKEISNSLFNISSNEDDNVLNYYGDKFNASNINNLYARSSHSRISRRRYINDSNYNYTKFNDSNFLMTVNDTNNGQINLLPSINDSIYSIPTVGTPTYIRNDNRSNILNNTLQNNNGISNINLNINGTLKLVSDNGSGSIDMSQLLNNPHFKHQLLEMIQKGLNNKNYLGTGYEKSSVEAISGGSDLKNRESSNASLLSI